MSKSKSNRSAKSNDIKTVQPKKKILVSACLYGYCCRYDGRSNLLRDKTFLDWKNRGLLVPVCPEVLGGLKTPRLPSEISDGRVINREGEDVSAQFNKGADEALKLAKENNVLFAIMKDGSPSCGCKHIYDGSFSGTKINGSGVCAKLLLENGIVVLAEDDMFTAKILFNEK
ncbi:MAG: DUF523 domain-containing protein [Clostridia bacterium]|nr:DUF523 domain-containing protein [Clostridia bacterium]